MKGRGHVVLKLLWTQPVLWLCLALGCLVSPGVSFGVAPEPVSGAAQYVADLVYRSGQGKDIHIGSAFLLREAERGSYRIRLDFEIERAGAFSALLMPEEKTLFVISYALSAYVAVPVQGDERFAGELVPSMAAAFMPFGVPALAIREEKRESLPAATHGKLLCTRHRVLYELMFMGDAFRAALTEWSSPAVPFLPVRVDELQDWDAPDSPRGSILLKSILSGELGLGEELFQMPEGFVRYGSALNMLLYALAAQW